MDFEPSDRSRELQARLERFVRERVEPAEEVYVRQLAELVARRGAQAPDSTSARG